MKIALIKENFLESSSVSAHDKHYPHRCLLPIRWDELEGYHREICIDGRQSHLMYMELAGIDVIWFYEPKCVTILETKEVL